MSFLSDLGHIAASVVKSPLKAGALVAGPTGASALIALATAHNATGAIDTGKALLKKLPIGVVSGQYLTNLALRKIGGQKLYDSVVPDKYRDALSIMNRVGDIHLATAKASTAAKLVADTAKLAQQGDVNAIRNTKLFQVVQAAKQGQPKAVSLVHQEVKKQVNAVLAAGQHPNASPEEKKLADLTSRLLKATVARKRYVRNFAVDKRTARVHRVA